MDENDKGFIVGALVLFWLVLGMSYAPLMEVFNIEVLPSFDLGGILTVIAIVLLVVSMIGWARKAK